MFFHSGLFVSNIHMRSWVERIENERNGTLEPSPVPLEHYIYFE